MNYPKKLKKTTKTKPKSSLFMVVLPWIVILLSVVLVVTDVFFGKLFMSTPIEFVAIKEQKVLDNNLLKKDTHKKAITIPNLIKQIPEARLKISKIGVDAVIKNMGLTSEGAMAVPDNTIDVGWFSLGTRPGDTGTAVIGAHDFLNDKAGVFVNLNKLQKGDLLSVADSKGASTSFIVTDIRTYDATDKNTGIFESESGAHLNLITCSGDWDPITKSSKQRLVIFTDVIHPTSQVATVLQ